MGRLFGFVAILFVVGACAGGEVSTETSTSTSEVVTTTEAPATTSTTIAGTTTTLSPDVNVPTAEALVAAITAGDEQAINDLPWFSPGGSANEEAVVVALFEAALNVEVVASSCAGETAELVVCKTQASDDLSVALGVGGYTVVQEVGFNDSGDITTFVAVTHDGGVGEVFTNWAWNIAYPGICNSPAQCAAALLGVVDEYFETYAGAVVASYVAAYNAGDVDAIMALFADDAVITGHPGGDYSGTAEIQALHEDEVDGTFGYELLNVTVDGDTVTWDHHWGEFDDNGLIIDGNCVDGHTAEIENQMFASWTWPVTDFQCD